MPTQLPREATDFFGELLLPHVENILKSSADKAQVPETSVNRDGGVREKFMFPPSILTQGSVDWGFLQISISRILHSCQNYR